MIEPSLDSLTEKIRSKYVLAVLAAKRARALMDEADTEEEAQLKPVTQALREIAEGRLKGFPASFFEQ